MVLTRPEVIDRRRFVTVAEVTTSIRGLAAEVDIDGRSAVLDRPSAVNCDGIHTIDQSSLSGPMGAVSDNTMRKVCEAIRYALDC